MICQLGLPAFAQGTAFMYQGRLNDGGDPANGTYDITLTLFSAATSGTVIGPSNVVSGLVVTKGLFIVTLDFGNQFPGANRWLEIAVRTNGAGAFATLTPRQELTATPYAVTAGNVVSGGLAAGSYSNAVTLNNPSNQISGSFSGNGQGLTNIPGTSLTGSLTNNTTGNANWATNLPYGNPTLSARGNEDPRIGIATYLMAYNGTNWYAGPGATNIYCSPNEQIILQTATNLLKDGMVAAGHRWICLEEGYQGSAQLSENLTAFPHGLKWLANTLHSLGIKLALYTDLADSTCCGYWGSGGSNTIPAANLFAYWGVDWIHADSCGWMWPGQTGNHLYGPFTEEKRRHQFEDFVSALRATNSNIGITMNMNLTPYAPWIGEMMNGWQIAPNGDGPNYWSLLTSMDWANLSAAQFRKGHTPAWYPFNPEIISGSDYSARIIVASDGVNISTGDTVTINLVTYTFRATPSAEGEVKIGANADASMVNLGHAIMNSGGVGGDYVVSSANPEVSAAAYYSPYLYVSSAHFYGTDSYLFQYGETAAHLSTWLQEGAETYGNGYYGAAMLAVGGAAMWQSELQFPQNMASEYERYKNVYGGTPQAIGTELSTNHYILKIDQDSLYTPPVKSFVNGTVEGWTKPLDDGTTALFVFNRGFLSNTIAPRTFQQNGNQQNVQATAVSLTVPVSFFGFRPGDAATFTQVLTDTNITSTTTVTIPCTTNHCTLWVVSNPNPTILAGDGSGLTNISHLTVNAASGVIGTVMAATGYQEETLYFSNGSTITSLTVFLPTKTVKGQIYRIHSKSAIATLSLTGTSFADAVVTSLAAGQTIAYQAYDGAGAYVRIQ